MCVCVCVWRKRERDTVHCLTLYCYYVIHNIKTMNIDNMPMQLLIKGYLTSYAEVHCKRVLITVGLNSFNLVIYSVQINISISSQGDIDLLGSRIDSKLQ